MITIGFTSCVSAQESSYDTNYNRKIEFYFKSHANPKDTIGKFTNYYINDSSFISKYQNDSNVFKVIRNTWYVDDGQGRFKLFYHPDSNVRANLLLYIKKYQGEDYSVYNYVKINGSKCMDGIMVVKMGIYNSSTNDCITTMFFAPKIGFISNVSSGYGLSDYSQLYKVIEYNRRNAIIKEYRFDLKEFYESNFKIVDECK